ncbi:MAG: DUF4301 family protein [Syntrophobacterales bacterium]|nr:MAG: DUF4301 family protein [Syntrophobacterales bacterium]
MGSFTFSRKDLDQITALGITEQQVVSQLEVFQRSSPYVRLKRPCTIGDGIHVIPEEGLLPLSEYHREAAKRGRCLKLVPASGAATRMFELPLWLYTHEPRVERDEIAGRAKAGEGKCKDLLAFIDRIDCFAFFDALKGVMAKEGLDIHALMEGGRFEEIFEYLLTPRGLNYANLPKGMIKFHQYPDESRTAFEEHLVEAAEYVRSAQGSCRLHSTVSPEHREGFEMLLEKVRPLYEGKYHVRFQVDFSVQRQSTNTIAVDLENRPFRLADGSLLFRPAGHGALIENLNNLKGDIIFIKNIDNIVPDRLKETTFKWKKALAGYLLKIQKRIFSYMEELAGGTHEEEFFREVLDFIRTELFLPIPEGLRLESIEGKRGFLLSMLNRPLRVCGQVPSQGEPGGGPFWVEGKDGALSMQIVERAQVDPNSVEQQGIWGSATHFNPVDIVCGVRDYRGNPFDLRQYVDPYAIVITTKSRDGRELKALELPGLWNGAMAGWITVFVEVPLITFNPVKTMNDLLRNEHQPQ